MFDSVDFSETRKSNYIVVVKDTAHDVLVKSFIANTTLISLWKELEVFYGTANIRSLKSGALEDPVLLTPKEYSVVVLGEILDTGVIKLYDFNISRSVDDLLSDFNSSQWSKSRDEISE